MKASKAACFVVLVFAILLAAFGTVMLLLPTPVSPVTVDNPSVYKTGGSWGNIYMDFTVENVSDKDVYISYIEVSISTNNGTETGYYDSGLQLKAGESYTFKDYGFSSYNNPNYITKITVKINGTTYYAYGTDPGTKPIGFALLFIGAIFAILTVASFVGVSKQNKRYAGIEQEVDAAFAGNALFVVGQYGKKGEAGKAIAKSTASAVGAAVFAGLFGFGAFKIYSANTLKEFVVTDDRLLVGNPSKKGFSLNTMDYMGKEAFTESEIKVKKKSVILKNKISGEYFTFNLASNKSVTVDQLVEKLNKLIAPVETKVQSEVAAENAEAPTTDNDPFDL